MAAGFAVLFIQGVGWMFVSNLISPFVCFHRLDAQTGQKVLHDSRFLKEKPPEMYFRAAAMQKFLTNR